MGGATGNSYCDVTTQPFWDACREHRLVLQYSPSRDRYQFYPRPFLAGDGATDLEWREASGYGVIHALAIVRLPLIHGWPPPYVVALVRLREGPVMMSNIIAPDGSLPVVRVGSSVRVVWRERTDGMAPLPVFTPI